MVRQFLPIERASHTKKTGPMLRDDMVMAHMIPTTAIITIAFHPLVFTGYE